MKCQACGRRFGAGETVLKSRQGNVACDNTDCTKAIDDKDAQTEAFSGWKQYTYSERGIEADAEIKSVTLKRTKIKDIEGDTYEVPTLDFRLSVPAKGIDMSDVQELHKCGLATINVYMAELERV